MEHTKEPWETNGSKWIVDVYQKYSVARCETEADARRIVACVNACAGIPTEKLESSGFGAVLTIGVLNLEQQNDRLLKFLESEADALDEAGMSTDGDRFREFVAEIILDTPPKQA